MLIDVAAAHGITQTQARATLDACLEAIQGHLRAGNTVRLQGFGSFNVKDRAARTGRNPRTGEAVEIAASRKVAFKPAANVIDAND